MQESDSATLARAREGQDDAFQMLAERHSNPLFRLAFRMTGNEQDAEDVVQETLLRAYRRLAKFDERSSFPPRSLLRAHGGLAQLAERACFRTWLYRITVNCSLDLVRALKRRSEQSGSA